MRILWLGPWLLEPLDPDTYPSPWPPTPTHTMRTLLALLFLSPAILAQDSVSKIGGFPGDALDPLDVNEQVNDFVVDLSTFKSSWGNTFGMAPIAKASDDHTPAPVYYNAQMSGQVVSKDTLIGVPFARTSYDQWSASGAGVNSNTAVLD